ncbi:MULTISPECIES: sensor histidine kinase KdpD [Reichenbachiella]|uniref:histidine kinase n=1 Tax=Reichenbachiella agariperforans TaxID=156994 RepID=A0A1M6NA44_REIAG|nr:MULTISPECIES: HAMP domain-containing sensor histidine kinase [Reichenbachiella]RJE71942.1 hypothetical protein BGP76_07620 [Reichenbachiella sp. MSK19-1]SHJ92541.1 two-component system, OmpR family, phosphate regulon sensor histidine kinase PhoR [Reichenbachiella agariperforans]
MNRRAFQVLVVMAAVSIVGTLAVQFFWMKKAFDVRNQQFDHNVKSALLNITESLCEINQEVPRTDAIEQVSSNYFIVYVNNKIEPKTLESLLKREFGTRAIHEGFEYGIFDCRNRDMVYGQYIDLGESVETSTGIETFPQLNKDQYYFGVYFPHKVTGLVSQMGIWIFSSLLVLVVVIFFALSLFIIFRQRRLSEVQKDFINNMTHEFRTPISTMAIAAEVLKTPQIVTQPERLSTYAEIVEREAYRLQSQVDRVLQMSNASKDQIVLKKEFLDMEALVGEQLRSYRISYESARLEMSVADDLPLIYGDKMHLGNVASNLIDNAIKYSDNQREVAVSLKASINHLVIVVADKGKGIDGKHLKTIFHQFYRVPTGNRHDVKGFGLGLYYVKMVVVAHGGKIEVTSQLGEGTQMTVTLPIDKP